MHNKIFITLTVIVYAAIATVFLVFPRSTYSPLEKRELAKMPEFSTDKLSDNSYTKELASWFSDSEPFRDQLMGASMWVRDKLRLSVGGDEAVSFHASADEVEPEAPGPDATPEEIAEYQNRVTANANAKIASKGIIVIGTAPNARALMAYGGVNGGEKFAEALNKYHKELGVNVYAMVIPLASEFYTPDKARKATKPQLPTIRNIYAHLAPGVIGVNAYGALAAHVNEDIYLRTDHHWAPLGAYYAAEALAKRANVPFKSLSAYDKKTVRRFVGSMYGYSKDMAVKNSPEDFVYYVPNGVDYNTQYIVYRTNKDYKVVSESGWTTAPFFHHYADGSGGAYCTFMGSDQRLTKVKTGTKNGRKLMIVKDSYGNAVPGYMFYSFEEVHVVDFRYFNKNMRKYVRDNGITDIAFVVNIFNAYSPHTYDKLVRFLTQGGAGHAAPSAAVPAAEAKKKQPAPSKETAAKPAEAVSRPQPDKSQPAKEPAKEREKEEQPAKEHPQHPDTPPAEP